MVVAETMLAASLVKAAISTCRTVLETTEDVSSIYGSLDTLFKHKDAHTKELANKKKLPSSKLRSSLSKTTHEDEEDETSIGAVAAEVLEQKSLDRAIENLARTINNKYGIGTWEEILELREEKIAEQKVKQEKQKKLTKQKNINAGERKKKLYHYAIEVLKVIFVIALGLGMAYTVWINRCQGSGCIG